MKIAIIIERADISLGGAERSVSELSEALTELDMQVHILAATGWGDTHNAHILCKEKAGKRVGFHEFAKLLKNHLSENHYDIIHSVLPFDFADVYQPRGGTYAESIERNAASYRNKLIESYKKLTAFTNLKRNALLRAEHNLSQNQNGPAILALSQYVADQFKHHYHTPEHRITLIHNGVKTDKPVDSEQADKLKVKIITDLGAKEADKPVLLLFAANNFRLKGLDCLIEAMKRTGTDKKERTAYLIVAGHGKIQKYQRLANESSLSNNGKKIIFLGPVSQIQNALSIADVAVLPTFYDPSSRFILEALGAGKPVITTRFNGATDLFTSERHGKIIDSPDNIKALTEAINFFTNTNNIRKTSEAIIKNNIKEKISIERVAGQLVDIYESILQKKGRT